MGIGIWRCKDCDKDTYAGGGVFADTSHPPSRCFHCGGHDLIPKKCPKCGEDLYFAPGNLQGKHICPEPEPVPNKLLNFFIDTLGNVYAFLVLIIIAALLYNLYGKN